MTGSKDAARPSSRRARLAVAAAVGVALLAAAFVGGILVRSPDSSGQASTSPSVPIGPTSTVAGFAPLRLVGPQTFDVDAGAQNRSGSVDAMGFFPEVVTIDVGDTVTWTVRSQEPHTVAFVQSFSPPPEGTLTDLARRGGTTFNGVDAASGFLLQGHSWSLRFVRPGVFPYLCQLHNGMTGLVVVRPAGSLYPLSPQESRQVAAQEEQADLRAGAAVPGPGTQPVSVAGGHATYLVDAGLSPPESTVVSLRPTGSGGPSGTAHLWIDSGDHLHVSVAMSGLPPRTTEVAELRVGLCDPGAGPISATLSPLSAGVDGSASSSTTVTPMNGLPEIGWYIDVVEYQQFDVDEVTPAMELACGNVSFHQATDIRFLPASLTVHPGDTVEWVNESPDEVHTVTFVPKGMRKPADHSLAEVTPAGGPDYSGGFANSGLMVPGDTWSLTFVRPGTYHYTCLIHDSLQMRGTIIVTR